MAEDPVSRRGLGAALALFLCATAGLCGTQRPALAYEVTRPIGPTDLDSLRRSIPESESFVDFFKERIVLAVGLDEIIDDNVFLQDNNKQEDFITYLESQILFADPRGALFYGVAYEVNAFRYHKRNQNAIDHDLKIFLDVETAGRAQYHAEYKLETSNSLLLGPEGIDILRRNSDFQQSVEHRWIARMSYALNETNALVPQIEYSLFDDQSQNDANTDRKILNAILDVDHDLKPEWVVFGGYRFRDTLFPGNRLKDSQGHGVRLGTRYELTEVLKLSLVSTFEHREWEGGQQGNDLNLDFSGTYQLGPRTEVTLGYVDKQVPSFTSTRLQFRNTIPSLEIVYELTPLTKLKAGAVYEKQRSGGKDVFGGAAATTAISRRYGLNLGLDWQFRENAHFTLDYSFGRSKTSDYTHHVWGFGIETEL